MAPRPTFQEPLQAECVEGQIVVTGPAHLHGAFSVDAARQSAKILEHLAQAAAARDSSDDQSSQTGSSDA